MSKKTNDVVITAALRTPIGTYKGSLKDIRRTKIRFYQLLKKQSYRSKLKNDDIDESNYGTCPHCLDLGQNPARQASIYSWNTSFKACTYY